MSDLEKAIVETVFRQEIVRHLPALRRYAVALVRHREHADDLVHETLLKAIEKKGQFRPGTNLRAWLFKILHNSYVDHVRRSIRQTAMLAENGPLSPETQSPDQDASLLRRDLEDAVSRLPDDQRTVLLLVALENMTYEEVAAIMEVPIGTVPLAIGPRQASSSYRDRSVASASRHTPTEPAG